jgi:poly(hydroxyalkanoate) granule-associated protein
MTAEKAKSTHDDVEEKVELTNRLEQVFLAGLGAMSAAGEVGTKTFESLVRQGEEFRARATDTTDKVIDEVQEAVRDITDDASEKAEGLFEQVRESSRVTRITSVFDQRVSRALKRLRIPNKAEFEEMSDKIDHLIKLVEAQQKKPAAKKAKKKAAKKPAAKKAD